MVDGSSFNRIYFDNAATSWPKPEAVYVAIDRYQREVGAAAGRGSYAQAESVDRLLAQTRDRIATLLGAKGVGEVVFTLNCTDALNMVLHGLLQPGDHVVSSVAEHNSVLRPLYDLQSRFGVESTLLPVNESGLIDPVQLEQAITPQTALIALTHASNVTGAIQPIEQIGAIARKHDCLFLVDAAQTIGHLPIDVVVQQVDFLAAPGHKGLLGPLGTGLLYVARRVQDRLRSVRQGGTGTHSDEPKQPAELPAKFESGNLNVPGLVGLHAGIAHVVENGLLANRELAELTQHAIDGLSAIPEVTIYSLPNSCGIVSFNVAGYDPREVAMLLDTVGSVQVRAGLHCAPRMHAALGTLASGGTVRASFGQFNTVEQVDSMLDLMRTFASGDS